MASPGHSKTYLYKRLLRAAQPPYAAVVRAEETFPSSFSHPAIEEN